MSAPKESDASHHVHGSTAVLILGSLGVVFGDIGTSPLYTFAECLHHVHGDLGQANIYGIVSLLFWSLTLVVTIKYVALLMMADNGGEGGIMALLTLLPERMRVAVGGRVGWMSLLVMAGAALLFGDGVITPAISVLSAMEGLTVADSSLKPLVVPGTVGILIALFAIQRRGTGALGSYFGPIMVVWFLVIGGLGARSIIANPDILQALSPMWAIQYFAEHGLPGAVILGSVVLAVTGGEALYADMGHFGRTPIRVAWVAVTYPALTLSYLGQGALILKHPETAATPFFSMVPTGPWTFALVALAACATVIASQGLISAVFSLTHQALRLGYLPRVKVLHTSSSVAGQIYVPAANWALAISSIALVLMFQESTKLAAAFGLAVSGTMAITSIVFCEVARKHWKWSSLKAGLLLLALLALDLPFFVATMLKFFDGGYLPFALGSVMFLIMAVWVSGRSFLADHFSASRRDVEVFLTELRTKSVRRLPGMAVVMSTSSGSAPPALAQLVQRFDCIHETVFLTTVSTEAVPWVGADRRVEVKALSDGFYRVFLRYGFMEQPVVPSAILHAIRDIGLELHAEDVVYLLSRESFMATNRGRMSAWRESLFGLLATNAADPTHYFNLPERQVVELGARVDL